MGYLACNTKVKREYKTMKGSIGKDRTKLTEERIYIEHPEYYGQDMIDRHIARYEWAVSKLNKDDSVLELCCGSGYGSHILAQNCNSVIAIDKSEEAISYAKKHYKKENLQFKVLDLTKEYLLINSNAVVWIEGIEHFAEHITIDILKNLKKTISIDGKLIISTLDKDQSDGKNEYHVKEYTCFELKDLIRKYFKIEEIYIENKFIYLVARQNG